jgi:hypothetical protein
VSSNLGLAAAKEKREGWLRRILLLAFFTAIVVYLVMCSFLWWAMHQPPEKFGRVMARMPGPVVFMLFPFETLWTHARSGTINVGDPAPDFRLRRVDGSEYVQLSELNSHQPVVLVFGSYT